MVHTSHIIHCQTPGKVENEDQSSILGVGIILAALHIIALNTSVFLLGFNIKMSSMNVYVSDNETACLRISEIVLNTSLRQMSKKMFGRISQKILIIVIREHSNIT